MAVHGGDLYFDIKVNTKPFDQSLAKVENSTTKAGTTLGTKFSNAFSKIGSSKLGSKVASVASTIGTKCVGAFTAAGTTLGTAFSAALAAAIPIVGIIAAVTGAVVGLTMKVAKSGDEIDKNSQKMGISSEAYQKWGYVLERCGSNIESMKPAMKKLAIAVESNSAAFQELGISQQELANMSGDQIFGRTIGALQNVEDKTRRTYLANQLLGRGATELGAVFNTSAAETDALMQRLDYLGTTMSEKGVKNSAALVDAWTDLKLSLRSFGNLIAEYVAPILTALINKIIIPAIVAIRKFYEALWSAIKGLFQLLGDILSKIPIIGKVVGKVKDFFSSSFNRRTVADVEDTANGMEDVSTGIGDTGSSAKKTKKDVQDLKRELMGFDKITKLQGEQKGTSSDSGITGNISAPSVSSVSPIDTGSLFDTSNIEQQSETWYEKLKKSFSEKWDKFKKWFDDTVGGWWDKHLGGKKLEIELPTWEELKQKVDNILGKFWDKIRGGARKLGIELPTWEELKQKIDKLLGNFWEKIRKGASKLGIELPTWSDLKQKLDNLLGNLWERFRKKNEGKITLKIPTWSELKEKWNNLLAKFKGKKAEIKVSIATIAKDAWNKVARKFNDLKAAHPIIMKAFPKLPLLAQGGYVKRNTPQLAMIGDNKREGEIVAPESKLAAMAAQAAAGGNEETNALLRQLIGLVSTLNLNVQLDGEQIKNNTVRRINQHTRATGQLEILI